MANIGLMKLISAVLRIWAGYKVDLGKLIFSNFRLDIARILILKLIFGYFIHLSWIELKCISWSSFLVILDIWAWYGKHWSPEAHVHVFSTSELHMAKNPEAHFQIFYASELDMAKINLLKPMFSYFRHLSWIQLKLTSGSLDIWAGYYIFYIWAGCS